MSEKTREPRFIVTTSLAALTATNANMMCKEVDCETVIAARKNTSGFPIVIIEQFAESFEVRKALRLVGSSQTIRSVVEVYREDRIFLLQRKLRNDDVSPVEFACYAVYLFEFDPC